MLIPILAIGSFLVLIVAVFLQFAAERRKSRIIYWERERTASKPPTLLAINEAFDPVYAVLWQAPIAALELIDSAGKSGTPVATLRPIYESASVRFPEIYDGCSFVQWLHCLEEAQLISWHGYNVVLTSEGHAFLKFRFVTDSIAAA